MRVAFVDRRWDNPSPATQSRATARPLSSDPSSQKMPIDKRAFLKLIGAATAAPLTQLAFAQAAYPSRPIKIIAPVQPGGGVELVARTSPNNWAWRQSGDHRRT
jgi:hypothetical protein